MLTNDATSNIKIIKMKKKTHTHTHTLSGAMHFLMKLNFFDMIF
jgi:hypothetical protein